MDLYQVRYANLKVEFSTKKLQLFFSESSEGSLDVFAMADPYGLQTHLVPGADLDDFVANLQPQAREVQDAQEAVGLSKSPQTAVQAHGVYTGTRQYIALGNAPTLYTAQPDAVNIWDTEITSDLVGPDGLVEFFGGEYWTDGGVALGDYVEFAVMDKTDVLGYFAAYGLSVANSDVLELAKYVRKRPLVSNEYGQIRPGQAAKLVPGLYLRTIFVAVATGAPRLLRISYDLAK